MDEQHQPCARELSRLEHSLASLRAEHADTLAWVEQLRTMLRKFVEQREFWICDAYGSDAVSEDHAIRAAREVLAGLVKEPKR